MKDASEIIKCNMEIMTMNGGPGRVGKIVLRIANKHRLLVRVIKDIDGKKYLALVSEGWLLPSAFGVFCNGADDMELLAEEFVSYWLLKDFYVDNYIDRTTKEADRFGLLSTTVSELEIKMTMRGY